MAAYSRQTVRDLSISADLAENAARQALCRVLCRNNPLYRKIAFHRSPAVQFQAGLGRMGPEAVSWVWPSQRPPRSHEIHEGDHKTSIRPSRVPPLPLMLQIREFLPGSANATALQRACLWLSLAALHC
ncbi:hypothetical protein AOLI_G00210980 [Acnodon oligacanthus]